MNYSERLLNPRWQEKRLKIMGRDKFTCKSCGSKENTLHVHHGYYGRGLDPWDYEDDTLHTLCKDCHEFAESIKTDVHRELARFPIRELEIFLGIIKRYRGNGNKVDLSMVEASEKPNNTRQVAPEIPEELERALINHEDKRISDLAINFFLSPHTIQPHKDTPIIRAAWFRYANIMLCEKRTSVGRLMTKSLPDFDGQMVTVKVGSKLSKELLDNCRLHIIEYLNRETDLKVDLTVLSERRTPVVNINGLSKAEVFRVIAEMSPKMLDIQQKYNLHIDELV